MVYEGGDVALERYWQLDYSRKHAVEDARELHAPLLRAAAPRVRRRRLVADVPLGAFLSGGIDSSAVVAAMAQESTRAGEDLLDRLRRRRASTSSRTRARSPSSSAPSTTSCTCAPTRSRSLPRLARHYGEPFADSSAIPSFYLAELTRRHVTVALNGDGGDETFAGYTRYAANVLAGRLERVPAPLRRLGGALGGAPARERPRSRALATGCAGSAARSGSTAPGATSATSRCFDAEQRASSTATSTRAALGDSRFAAEAIAEPWREASGSDAPRRPARGRRPHLPARRPAGQDRHRHDGALAGGALALPRPRADAVRGLDPGADEAARDARRRWSCATPCAPGCRTRSSTAPSRVSRCRWPSWLRGELRGYSRELLLDPASLGAARLPPRARSRRCSTSTPPAATTRSGSGR